MRSATSDSDLARKPRLPIPLDDDLYQWLETLSEKEDRDKANMVIVLLKASRELLEGQSFRLLEGKFRKVQLEPLETEKSE